MTKNKLIQELAKRKNISIKTSKLVVDTIVDTLSIALISGDHIELRGFGSFSIRSYKSYVGRNPKTGKKIHVKPKKMPHFKVSKQLCKLIDS